MARIELIAAHTFSMRSTIHGQGPLEHNDIDPVFACDGGDGGVGGQQNALLFRVLCLLLGGRRPTEYLRLCVASFLSLFSIE